MAFNPELLIEEAQTQTGTFRPQDLLTDTQEQAADVLGANLDTENFASSRIRLSISRGDTLEEKKLKLKKFHPEGDVRVITRSVTGTGPEKPVTIFRESPQAQWKFVEPPGFDLTDIGEAIVPSAESIVGETIMAVLSRGASIPGLVARQAAGAAGGELVEQGVQSLQGTQQQSFPEILAEAGGEGAASGIGGFAMSPLVAGRNIAGGRGALQVGDEGLEVIEAARRLDPSLGRQLTPGMVTDNPALLLQERQSAALLPGLNRRYRDLVTRLDNIVRSNIDQSALGNTTRNLVDASKRLSDDFVRRLGGSRAPASRGGRAIQQGIEEYAESSKLLVDDLYDLARGIEEPQFDFSIFQRTAHDLRVGAKGTLDKDVRRVIDEIQNIKGPRQLSPDPVTGEARFLSVTDQIRNARTQLHSIANVPPGELPDQAVGQATELLRATKEMLDNPLNSSPAFKKAWDNAARAAGDRLDALQKAAVVKAAKTENPADIISQFARPGQVDNLATLRLTVNRSQWDEFTSAWQASLLDDPATLSTKFDAFDQETLDVLMPRADQQVWRKMGRELDRITDLGVDNIAEAQITNKRFVNELITKANPQRTRTVIRSINQTNDKATRDSLRAAIFDWTWEGILKKKKNSISVNRNLLDSRVKDLKESGLWRVLTPDQRRTLSDADIVARSFERLIDAGTSIQAAEAAKGIGRLERGAIRSFIQAGVISHFYLSNTGRKILIGSGLPNTKGKYIRLVGGVLAQTSRTEDLSQFLEENE